MLKSAHIPYREEKFALDPINVENNLSQTRSQCWLVELENITAYVKKLSRDGKQFRIQNHCCTIQ